MDWDFKWVSSQNSDFNFDFHVSFRPEEIAAHKAIYNFREFDPDGMADCLATASSTRTSKAKFFTPMARLDAGASNFSASSRISMFCQKAVKNMDRVIPCPTGRKFAPNTTRLKQVKSLYAADLQLTSR